jgi:hypothetical protein
VCCPVVEAFDGGLARNVAKVPTAVPLELCYRFSMLGKTHRPGLCCAGHRLGAQRVLRATSSSVVRSSMVDVNSQTTCGGGGGWSESSVSAQVPNLTKKKDATKHLQLYPLK